MLAQGNVAVFFAFTLSNVEHLAVEVQVCKADVAGFKAAQATAVEQGQQQALYLLLAQNDRQGFIVLNAGQLNAFVFEPFHAEDETEAVDGELEVSQGGRVVLLAQQVEVIVDLVGVELGRQAVEVQGQLGQVAGLVGEGALASAGNGDFLAELFVKFAESSYISTGSLDKGLLLFLS